MYRWLGITCALTIAFGGCIGPSTPNCNGLVCPADKVCDPHRSVCVLPSQVDACADAIDGTGCVYPGETEGVCDHGVCFSSECGDGLTSAGEVCDDANEIDGDGCSAQCRSDERCGNAIVDVAIGESCDDGGLQSGDGCSSACTAEVASWHELELDPYPGAHGGEAVYDIARRRVVMIGGTSPTGSPIDEVFELYNGQWDRVHQRPRAPGRDAHVVVYDAKRRATIVFGGRRDPSNNLLADTWAYDGTWREITGPGPSARQGAAGAYDAARDEVVVFGGATTGGVTAETWVLSGTTWMQRAVAGPPARRDHRMAFDPVSGRVVLFGGTDGATALTDTWEWNGSAWTQVTTATTAPAARGAMVFAADRGTVMLVGGDTATNASTWELVGGDWAEVTSSGFTPRRRPAVAYDPIAGEIVLRGGTDKPVGMGGPPLDDTWRFTAGAWTLDESVEPHAPPARNYGGFVFDRLRSRFVLVGGDNPPSVHRADTWTYDGEQWLYLGDTPGLAPCSAPSCPGVAVELAGTGTLLFVKFKAMNPVETWRFDGATWSLVPTTNAPASRMGFALAYDEARGVVVLFGGTAGPNSRNDVWELSGTSWTERTQSLPMLPPARGDAAMTYDAKRGVIVMFGGTAMDQLFDDTWLYDGTMWTRQETSSGPQPRAGVGLTFHTARGTAILFGGVGTNGPYDDTWELDEDGWERITVFEGPAPRRAPRLAYDAARKLIVLHGGDPATDTWELVFRSTLDDEVCDGFLPGGGPAADTDEDGLTGCEDPDCETSSCETGKLCTAGACTCAFTSEVRCGDGLDDDCDGMIDCADSDCASAACEAHETLCADSSDNDGDGRADCRDVDCYLLACTEVLP